MFNFDLKQGCSALGDFVWLENLVKPGNVMGQQDIGEAGVQNIDVELLNSNMNLIIATKTNVNGNYLFINLAPGDYYVTFGNQADGTIYEYTTFQAVGVDGQENSDAHTAGNVPPMGQIGKTDTINMSPNEIDLTWDAGLFVPEVSPTPTPTPSISITPSPTPSITPTPNLSITPTPTPPLEDCIPEIEENIFDFELTEGCAALGDFVWLEDLVKPGNVLGQQDNGEPGVPNVRVELLDSNMDFLLATSTNVNGNYLFINLQPGDYFVKFAKESNGTIFEFTTYRAIGVDGQENSDAHTAGNIPPMGAEGKTDVIEMSQNEVDLTWDAGLLVPPDTPTPTPTPTNTPTPTITPTPSDTPTPTPTETPSPTPTEPEVH